MIRHSIIILLFSLSSSLYTKAQPGFKQIHELECIEPPLVYVPSGRYQQVLPLTDASDNLTGYIVLGEGILSQNIDFINHPTRAFISRVDPSGNIVWCKRLDNPNSDSLSTFGRNDQFVCTRTFDGNFAVCLQVVNVDSLGEWTGTTKLIRFNEDGETLSEKVIPHPWDRFDNRILEDPRDSCLVLFGSAQHRVGSPFYGREQAALIKLQRNDSVMYVSVESSIQPDIEASIYTVLHAWGENEYLSIRLGLFEWSICNGDMQRITNSRITLNDSNFQIQADLNLFYDFECGDNYSIFGVHNDTLFLLHEKFVENYLPCSAKAGNYYIQKVWKEDSSIIVGDWTHTAFFCDWHQAWAVDRAYDGSLYVTGEWSSEGTPTVQSFIYKTNTSGDSLWFKKYYLWDGHPQNRHVTIDCSATPDGGLVSVGYARQAIGDPHPGAESPWIFKVDSHGCIEPGCQFATQVEEVVIGLTDAMRVYPNPAETWTTVSFALPAGVNMDKASHLVLFDLTGKELQRIVVPAFASTHTLEIDTSALPSGVYSLQWVQQERWLDAFTLVRK